MLPCTLAWIAIFAAACALAACDHCGNFPPTSQLGACHGGPPPQ
jgi:hypothetical protein